MTMWRWSGLLAIITVLAALSFSAIPGIEACPVKGSPVLAWELTGSPEAAQRLYPPACRTAQLAAQREALRLDTLAFVPAYGLFLIATLAALAEERGERIRRAVQRFALLVVIAMIADWWENDRLLTIADMFPGTQRMFDQLYPAVRLKFILLGTVTAIAGTLHMLAGGWRRLTGLVIALAGAWGAAAVFGVSHLVGYPLALGWGLLGVVSLVLALRPRNLA